MNRVEGEKALKRYLKRSIGYSLTILVGFLINGQVSLGADINKELQIQNLLKSIEVEKEELNNKLLELDKELSIVKNSKDSSIQFFLSTLFENRKAKKSDDNGFSKVINDWEESLKDKPNIDIPDIRDDVKPVVPDIPNPLPNEDSIVVEPDFGLEEVEDIAIGDIPKDINIDIGRIDLPVNEINDGDFNILTNENISTPEIEDIVINDVNIPDINSDITTKIQTPIINNINDLPTFNAPEIEVAIKDITAPESFPIKDVKIKADGFNQGGEEDIFTNYDLEGSYQNEEDSTSPIVIQNYTKYTTTDKGFDIYFNEDEIHYHGDGLPESEKKKIGIGNGNNLSWWGYNPTTWTRPRGTGLRNKYSGNTLIGTFISDVTGNDVDVEGQYNVTYEGHRNGNDGNDYIRMFLSSNPAGIINKDYGGNNKQTTKITDFKGELNLSTTNGSGGDVKGNLIGLEHQTWDKLENSDRLEAFKNSYSVLVNSGTINLGKGNDSSGNVIELPESKNMIGIMIDLEQSSGVDFKNQNNKTINSGEINIYGTNSIGVSFEEYRNQDNLDKGGHFILRDDMYVGDINIAGTQNYGFKMGNIFSDTTGVTKEETKNEFATYFDKTKIIGSLNNGETSITIKNDDGTDRVIENYTSKIVVGGKQNAGMVVGKSLSNSASDYINEFGNDKVNPIANFENISIEVNGEQTIGFVRDKNYSDNNKNDMVITDKNINDIKFGNDAKNSVLFRSEMYGITNSNKLDVSGAGSNHQTNDFYNIAMQATRQSWDKDGDGNNDINSSGNVTNNNEISNNEISGTVNNMIGMMASGKTDFGINSWQNNEAESKAKATNTGNIKLTGKNNIGMAILDDNEGNNSGNITIKGNDGIGVYNTGTFTNSGTIDVDGKDGIAIYNKQEIDKINRTISKATLNLDGTTINIADNSEDTSSKGATAIYSEGGTINFGSNGTKITDKNNSTAGVYTKGDTNLNGKVNISGTKAGIVADSGTASITGGNITYSGEGFALYTKDGENGAKGKITLDKDSSLTLDGNSYGYNIDTSKYKDDSTNIDNRGIIFNGSTININSNYVTIFNIDGKNNFEISSKSTSDTEKEVENNKLPSGISSLEKYVGNIKEINDNGKLGYKIASIENGIIKLEGNDEENVNFLKKYKFKKSIVNMTTDTNLSLSNKDADTYFKGEVIGIGISSNESKNETPTKIGDTQINITNTLTANRTETAPKTPQGNSKSTIGAYINYGEVNLTNGHIVVENDPRLKINDTVNDNGIGIYSKNGSKITTDKNSSITVHGNNGIGIYGEATKNGKNTENKTNEFGGNITSINIDNKGKIDISSGESGVGIYADASTGDTGIVTNSGNITVGGGAEKNSSIGIYGINTNINNTGKITVGCNHNENKGSHTGVGIYAVNSTVTTGGTITLGDYATGIYLDKNSNLDTQGNQDLTFTSLDGNTTDRIGIYAVGEKEVTNNDININFDIDMGNVVGGKAIVAKDRKVTNSNTISISSENGRGMRALDYATITNEGNIIVGDKILLNDINNTEEKQFASIGMTAANTNGTIHNSGTITVNSTNGIGIYVDNSDENVGKNNTIVRDNNIITSIGTIKLNGEKNIGVVTKGTELTLDGDNLSAQGISFEENSKNSIGIYADEGSTITVNENISKIFTENQTNNILIASITDKDNLETEIKEVKNNGTISLNGKDNIGIYLSGNTKYTSDINNDKNIKGSINVSNGAIGIYADKGSSTLENINITSDSMGIQTIGVVLNGENKENKNISGTVTLTNSNNEVVQGKNLGIYANNSDVTVSDNLTLFNDGSNGTGLYLNNSTLSGKGTIKIIGEGKENSEGKISNSVGIYYTSNEQEGITSSNSITVEVDKSNTIGVYVANGSTLTKQSGGGIIIGTTDVNKVENVTGLVTSAKSTINNNGIITLGNTSKSIGIASLGGTVNNSGKITIGKNSKNGTGIFLSGESKLENTGTITIAEVAVNDKDNPTNSHLGIGIYAKGEDVIIGNTGSFDMTKGNVAIYSDGTNISSDISLVNGDKNIETIALVTKSDDNGTLIGNEDAITPEDRMKITLAKGSTGIYALDSGVKISNVSINATANEGKNGNLLSYGIYLGAEDGNYEIDKTDISLVKGVGIVVNTTDKNKDTSLTLTNSTLNIASYSEGDKAETGIGIYTQSGNITLAGGNTINTTYGVGIFGEKNSTINENSIINVGNGATKDILNIKGYSVGVYSKGGEVNLGANTEINFQKRAAQGESTEVSKGVGAYVIDGNITSSANINTTEGVTSENVVGLLGKQTDDKNTDITITNKGNIKLAGNSVIGIAGLGSEKSNRKVTITNEGTITISGNKENLSTGIYGENADINNAGTLMVGQFATGIFYTGTKVNDITSNDITLNGTDSMGAILKGTAGVVNIGNISGSTDRSLGIYLDNYKSSSTNIGDITLGNNSMGLYINNKTDTNTIISKVGDIIVGTEGFGIASIGNSEGDNPEDDIVTIANNGKIEVGDFGTAVYVEDSTLNMKSLAGVTAGKNGTVLHVNDGTLNLDSTINELTFDGNIGMILENGGDITSKNGEVSTINIKNGGTGIIVKGDNTNVKEDNTKRPGILADNTTINLGSGNENSYSVGIYYQDANVISNNDKDSRLDIDIVRENGSHHTIGTIYDRTYGTIDNFNIVMDNSISDSIGTIIRRDTKKGNYEGNTDENKVVLNSGTNSLVDVNGENNIGIIGKNSIIEANGDIKVGLDETSSGSIGVYLTGTDSNWKHSYTGTGDINVGSHSIGIYAKNYDATHNGNITASGEESVGIASVILDDEEHEHPHTITVNNSTLTVKDGAIGIFGRDTEVAVDNGKLNVSGNNSTGIASLQDGDINFTGSANISGKGSSGIYKNTILDNTLSQNKSEDTDTITVGNGNWIIDDTASGIVAISRNKDANGNITDIGNSIKIDNSSNMTLGNGAIGIYSAGANIVNNKGNITVGAASIDGKDTLASIGIYMANGVGNTMAIGTNNGNISVESNGGVGIQAAGYVDFTNNGKIDVANGAEGMHASVGATVTNNSEITVTGKGTGMIATGEGSKAINNKTITLIKNDSMLSEEEKNNEINTSLIGMAATNGGYIENNGTINVNDGIGMYVDKDSSLANNGIIELNDGIGILGTGQLKNKGTININSSNATEIINKDLDEIGSLVVDREEGILKINDNFSNIGGILETDYNIKLNNPTVDITAGGAGFIAPNISGDIKLDSNFALEGNGLSFSVEDFIDPEADININTSPLFKTDITEGDLTVNKVDYKDITLGNQFDNRDNSLDNILANGGVDADILKTLNYYLDSLGNTPIFDSEADRVLGAIGGNIYSNIQSRMQDISRTFDNSFEEMVTAPNPTYENTKYSLIYTNGDYENKNENVVDYEYDIKGINYMKEYDLSEQGERYGYTFGFTGAKFEFDDFSKSEEDIYSLRGGAHRISYLDNSLTWFSRAEVGYNHHRVDRKVVIPGATENGNINNNAWYGSYQVSLDNKLRKEIFANENSNFGAYTALNLEYGLFDDIKESGNLELKVRSNDYFSSKAVIGLDGKFSKAINDSWSIRLNGDINYSYDFGDNYDENDARFRSQDSYYSLASEVESRDVLSGKLSVGLDKSDYMSIALHAQAFRDFRRNEDYWNAGLTFTYRFNNHAVPEKFLDMHNYFKFDNSELNSNDKENIKEMAEYINKNNMQGTLLIEGHTDDTGKASYNDKLSLKRANAVKEEFEKTLTNKDNIQVKVIGHGEEKPEYKNTDESARSKNRRAQVNILNK